MAAFIIWNEELEDLVKIVKPLEESGILIKKTLVKLKAKEQTGEFLTILLGTLTASTLRNMLAGRGVTRTGEGITRAGQYF